MADDRPLDVALHVWQSALFEATAPGGATRTTGAFKLLHELETRVADGCVMGLHGRLQDC